MRSIIIFTTVLLNSAFCIGQTDSTVAATAPVKSTLTLAAIYANNASYYGQRSVDNTPYAAIAASYRLKSGIYFTAQTYKLLKEKTSSVSAGSVGAGVNFMLGKKLSADLGYSHSFYPSYSPLLQAANADNASLSLSHNGWFTTSITGDYAFGKANDAFVTAALSKSITLFSIGKADAVSITPSADVVGGTQRYYQTYVTEKTTRDSILGLPVPIFGNGTTTRDSSITASSDFNVLSYNFKLPLSYSRAHYTVEALYQLSVLGNKSQANNNNLNSFFTFSFYYQF